MSDIGQFLIQLLLWLLSFGASITSSHVSVLVWSIIKFKNKEQKNFDLLLQRLFICWCFRKGKTEYNSVNFLSNVVTPMFLIAQSNITYSFLSYISTSHWNNTQVLAHSFCQQVPRLSNRCTFAFRHPNVWEHCTSYWVRAE